MAQQYASQQPAGYKNHVENVAIIGAGGNVGRHIAASLIAQGRHRVTALSRPTSTAQFPAGLHAVKRIDYDDPTALTAALRGEDVLIITLAAGTPAPAQERIIDAAVAAGVKYIMPNEYGSDQSNASLARDTLLGDACRAIRAYVERVGRAKGTRWIALSCSFWYEFSLAGSEARYGFDFDRKTLTLFDDGNTRICTSTWKQCGRAVAALLALPILPESPGAEGAPTLAGFADSAVYIASFVLSQREMLASVLRVTGGREEEWTISSEPTPERYARGKAMLEKGSVIGFGILLYTRVFYPNGDGDYSDKLVNDVLGLPKEDLDEATKEAIRMHEAGVMKAKPF